MVISPHYELVEVADELLAVPIGEAAEICKDVFTFSKAAATLVKKLKVQSTMQDLVEQLVSLYDIDYEMAIEDVKRFVSSLSSYGLIIQ